MMGMQARDLFHHQTVLYRQPMNGLESDLQIAGSRKAPAPLTHFLIGRDGSCLQEIPRTAWIVWDR